jgi:hypothetical protein
VEEAMSWAVLSVLLACLAIVLEPSVRATVCRMDRNEKKPQQPAEEGEVLREEDITVADRLDEGAVEDREVEDTLRDA